jgi:hypothetical protein
VAVALDVERAVGALELRQVDRRQVAGRVVEEQVLRAVVDDEARGHEVRRLRLGQVEHDLLAQRLEAAKRSSKRSIAVSTAR